ncbi:response regulator transcription factor [Pseudooceanicola sp. CBS1P-1]|uniref:Response regulator n=1 Tax=Pseudooceanicola albus TaxID=2692189 RepID=A0A6L7G107_9RHOB|nr:MULTISPECIES: response regulator transcription factor [Pseudooceanicola]MBT9383526.1 response regulator transcription factor [Pseudooceanicola endophyticus]MXN17382.1 response regulator [Pseudooceanicola albus]
MSARILLIEDETAIRRFLRVALESEGHDVLEAASAREGLAQAARTAPDAVILDLGLPDADGLSVLQGLRGWSEVPVLVLSVRADEAGKVQALDAGAQDYVTKPFSTAELLARIRSLLRDRRSAEEPGAEITLGPLRIDAAAHQVQLAGDPLSLTRREFDLLWMLARHAGRLLTQEMILRSLWGEAHAEDTQYLRVYIRQLRAKLGDDAANPRWIFTEPGIGYRMASE